MRALMVPEPLMVNCALVFGAVGVFRRETLMFAGAHAALLGVTQDGLTVPAAALQAETVRAARDSRERRRVFMGVTFL